MEPNDNQQPYSFDPSSIVKIIVENKELGLALVQIPLQMLNNWIGGNRELEWENKVKFPGYYWTKDDDDMVSIIFVQPDDLSAYSYPKTRKKFAGPLIPPK